MKQKFMSKSLDMILKYNKKYSKEDIDKLNYGLEGLYLTFTKLVVILFLAIILNILPQVIGVLLLFNIIRFTGFGFHAEKSWHCLIFSTFCFIVIPYILLLFNINTLTFGIISILALVMISLFAPADTKKRPLPNRKKRLIRKVLTIIFALVYIFLGLIFKNETLRCLLASALIIQSIVICPLTYMLFKQPFNNYKRFQKA